MNYELLHEKIKEVGVTKVADALGISRQTLYNSIARKNMWVTHLEEIAKGLNMPVSAFFDNKQEFSQST